MDIGTFLCSVLQDYQVGYIRVSDNADSIEVVK